MSLLRFEISHCNKFSFLMGPKFHDFGTYLRLQRKTQKSVLLWSPHWQSSRPSKVPFPWHSHNYWIIYTYNNYFCENASLYISIEGILHVVKFTRYFQPRIQCEARLFIYNIRLSCGIYCTTLNHNLQVIWVILSVSLW
jgi:hypothetical protein